MSPRFFSGIWDGGVCLGGQIHSHFTEGLYVVVKLLKNVTISLAAYTNALSVFPITVSQTPCPNGQSRQRNVPACLEKHGRLVVGLALRFPGQCSCELIGA